LRQLDRKLDDILVWTMRVICFLIVAFASLLTAADRPNILWISSEDNGPHLGVYGDDYATTPVLDALGRQGIIYRNAWSTAPVCAPARTTIISGLYPPSTGSQHMRSLTRLPSYMKMYPQYLRDAGYYVSNNAKEDYNLEKPGQVWDESSREAHWRKRADGQPFFAIFNFTITHESQIRKRPHSAVHDPAKVKIPAYHPDTPESRQDWAQYHDKMTEMDGMAGEILAQLKEDGLEEDTVVFYWGDHGPGMPRGKRWTYNSGLSVPMILYVPEKFKQLRPEGYKSNGESDRLIGFIDLPATVLSLAGVKPPNFYQGHAFAGEFTAPEQPYNYAFRGRMDERYDMVRSVRDKRYIYIKNFKPHKIYGQYIDYMFQTPTTRVWHELYTAGKLKPPMTYFWETKPAEELYDLENDPDEVVNLAGSAKHKSIIERFRAARRAWSLRIRDVGFLPEGEIHERAGESTPYDMGHDEMRFPMRRVMEMAEAASSLTNDDLPKLKRGFDDTDSAVRYWAAMGALMREKAGVNALAGQLRKALADASPYARIAAAEALGRYGSDADARKAVEVLLPLANAEKQGIFVAMPALNALDYMDERARPALATVTGLPTSDPKVAGKFSSYLPNLIKKIKMDLN
jgi:arylsulfatase A-like enzyme